MRKIRLSRETLRILDRADAGRAVGGRPAPAGGGFILVSLFAPDDCIARTEMTGCPSQVIPGGCAPTIDIIW